MALQISPIPTHIAELVRALEALGFQKTQDSPGSGALAFNLPDGRQILVTTDLGGWWPETDFDGAYIGLYGVDGDVLESSGAIQSIASAPAGERRSLLESQIREVVECLARWTA